MTAAGWIAYFSLVLLLIVAIACKLFQRVSSAPRMPEHAHPEDLARARGDRPVWDPPGGYLAGVLEVSRHEPAIVSGYGDGERRRLTVRTFPQGTYYLIENPGRPVVEVFLTNAGDRVPVTSGMIVGGVE